MKISKKVREEAILICDVAASTYQGDIDTGSVAIDLGLDNTGRAMELARCARLRTSRGHSYSASRSAEAAQRLREGWTP